MPLRSPVASTIRAICYWLAYQSIGHLFTIRVERARCCLSLHDRHFVDTLVDPRRYRYAGPNRLLHLIWRITPKPDLLICLAPPPQIIQARKPEVPPDETARQCLEYRSLARKLSMASVFDTSVPLAQTLREVARILIDHMAARTRQQLRVIRDGKRHADVRRVLDAMTGDGDGNSWMLTRIGSGNQAHVYEVSPNDDAAGSASADGSANAATPGPRKQPPLVVKLFRPDRPDVAIAAAEEFTSLRQLHSLLDDVTIDGWRIGVPAPLFLCNHPLAVIMTRVPGQPLNSLLASANQNGTPDASTMSHVLATALGRFWSVGGRIYGDFTLSNILCDPGNHQISLVDPGMPEQSYACPDVARHWYPASRDVAFMLYDTATSIRQNLGHPILRRRHWQVVVKMLEAIVGKLPIPESQREFLIEVEACTRVHLKRIAISWSPSGGLHLLVRCLASLRMRLLFSRLRNASFVPCGLPGTESLVRHTAASAAAYASPPDRCVARLQRGDSLPGWAEELKHDEPNA